MVSSFAVSVQRALLLIADIGGYTRFMKVHRINLAHAQEIVGALLEAVIDGAGERLTLSKLEGDAALFYALEGEAGAAGACDVHDVVEKIRHAFLEKRTQLEVDRICSCDGCTQVGALKLKFVVHAGEVAIQKVKSFRELAGMDVILVHRMLKNGVPASEYVLMTDKVLKAVPKSFRERAQRIEEDFEGVGKTKVHYVDLATEAEQKIVVEPSRWRAIWEYVMLNLRSLVYIFGAKKACALFRNMDVALGKSEPTPPALPSAEPRNDAG
jgi:hypothetical protein